MLYIFFLLMVLMSLPLLASDWPEPLVRSTFDHCTRVGGKSQCQCVVTRLQEKFTFEDMRLASKNKLAKKALSQMLRTFNMKCLGKEYKEQTLKLEDQQKLKIKGANRFR